MVHIKSNKKQCDRRISTRQLLDFKKNACNRLIINVREFANQRSKFARVILEQSIPKPFVPDTHHVVFVNG